MTPDQVVGVQIWRLARQDMHPVVHARLARHPRFNMHFTPTSAAWLNMVEWFLRDITDKRLRRRVFTTLPDLVTDIDEYVVHHNTPQVVHLDQERLRHPVEGQSR